MLNGVLPLWSGEAPGAVGRDPEDIPTLSVYTPPPGTSNGSAVVICPGGGYGHLADHEGKPVAEWLNTLGVTAFVVKYRIAPRYRHPDPMQDALRAMRTVRARAWEWDIAPHRVGILGFSAGGHLASTVAVHADDGVSASPDPVERQSARPNAAILIYPVISLESKYAHVGSRQNLLGADAAPELVRHLSTDLHVTAKTPPTFLVHTAEDTAVPAENSLRFAMALRAAGVPVELHLYEHGAHGFGLAPDDPVLSAWPVACAAWLRGRGFLTPQKDAASW